MYSCLLNLLWISFSVDSNSSLSIYSSLPLSSILLMLCCKMLQFRICVYRPTGSIGPTRRKNSGYPAGFDIIMLILQEAPVPDLCVPAPRVHRLNQAKTDPVYPVEFDIILMMICRRMLRCRICVYLPPGSIGPTRLKRIPDIQPDAG